MTKLARYLKPYILPLVFCVLFLFGQAMCDLNLPNLMSDIVNVGIQQSGIEETVPKAVSAKGMNFLKLFMTEEQKSAIEQSYTQVSAGSSEAEAYSNDYPLVSTEDILVLRADADTEAVESSYGQGIMTFVSAMKEMAEQEGASTEGTGADDLENVDFSKLYEMQPMLEQLPSSYFDSARESAGAVDSSLLSQMGVVVTKAFYEELGIDTGALQMAYILRVGLYMLLLTLAGALATIGVGLLASRIAAGVARALRHDVFSRVENFGSREFDEYSTASLITRTTNDVMQVQMLLIIGIRMICYAPIMGIGGVVMAVNKSVSMSWIIAIGVVVLIGLILLIYVLVMPKFKIVQKLIDRLNLVTRENLSGMMVIRAFGTQQFEEKRFDGANKDLTQNNLYINRAMTFMMPAMMFMMNIITLIIVWVGGHQIEQSAMQVGDMMAFMQYAMQVIMSFLMIAMMFIMVPRAAVSGERIAEVLETKPDVLDAKAPVHFPEKVRGEVTFDDVSFRYNKAEDMALEHITFTARPGQTTAIIGSTGSGKSTLVNLIPRFYDVTEGRICIDGVDVRAVPQHELRENISFVPQKGVLFSGTIESNLSYGSPAASKEAIEKAAEVAQAKEFIEAKPEGYEEPISQGGDNVSGGQKQRLSIGRALTKNAPIYVFDDSFSALDFKTDAALRRALKQYTGDAAVLIVAQRVSTIMNAEQILVLEDGRIVGRGTHKELLQNCSTYREIAMSQLSEEELK
ncbi:ABC transporter ATP-binding protein [Hydrogeniiclostridium mannosilyticum]|uniref:ABC transporter ATP-binding protein n=1 Tax=Hydrogeniiclostridium mannosilyticum TaxID=2764322 RepID=A0A328UG48_9FIRM|nr:ABC transporter ATP-binding protein [Hydrogeniiclostridium mannosilyticum]RAQ30488.1 ABC transporter ATP-binding protein [Hydrogeniiclostridium mannosilyticum]